jgi:hypothetical protein
MKISELLGTTITELNIHCPEDAEPLEINWPHIYKLQTIVEWDAHHFFSSLNYLISRLSDTTATADNLKPLRVFLKNRWEQIRQTDFSYTCDMTSSINTICFLLANEICSVLNVSSYQLLMPTVQNSNSSVTGTPWNELEFSEFVMSDDDTAYIEVHACLESAEEDNCLKHTSLFAEVHELNLAPGIKRLTPDEAKRVIHHSNESRAYYRALAAIYDIKNRGMTVGAYLQRLMNLLVEGGVGARGIADHFVPAGSAAIRGILECYEFLKLLTPDQLAIVYAATSPSMTMGASFKEVWFRLLSRVAIERTIVIPELELQSMIGYLTTLQVADEPCVELFANAIHQVLLANQNLYAISSAHESSSVMNEAILQSYQAMKSQAKRNLLNVTKSIVPQKRSLYGTKGEEIFIRRVWSFLVDRYPNTVIFNHFPKDHFASLLDSLSPIQMGILVKDKNDLKKVLRLLGKNLAKRFLWKKFTKLDLANIFMNATDIQDILSLIHDTDHHGLLDELTDSDLKILFVDAKDFLDVLDELSEDNVKFLLTKLGKDFVAGLITEFDDLIALQKNNVSILFCWDLLGKDHFLRLADNSDRLLELLTECNHLNRHTLYHFIGPSHFKSVIRSLEDFKMVEVFDKYTQKIFVYECGDEAMFTRLVQNQDQFHKLLSFFHRSSRGALLSRMESGSLQRCFSTWQNVSTVLTRLYPTDQVYFLNEVLTKTHLRTLFDSSAFDLAISTLAKELITHIYLCVGARHIASIITSLTMLHKLTNVLSDDYIEEFLIEYLETSKLDLFIASEVELNFILKECSSLTASRLLLALSVNKFNTLINTSEKFMSVMSAIPDHQHEDFCFRLTSQTIGLIFSDAQPMLNCLRLLNQDIRWDLLGNLADSALKNSLDKATMVSLLALLTFEDQLKLIEKLSSKQLEHLFIGDQYFFHVLAFIDHYKQDVNLYSSLLLVCSKICLHRLEKTHAPAVFTDAIKAFINVINVSADISSLMSHREHLREADIAYLVCRYEVMKGISQPSLLPIVAPVAERRLGIFSRPVPPPQREMIHQQAFRPIGN